MSSVEGVVIKSINTHLLGADKTLETQVAIIGSGPVGSSVAWRLANAGIEVTVIEAGGQCGSRPGEHLRNNFRCQSEPSRFHALRSAHLDPISSSSRCDQDLPAAAKVTAVGGAGIVWSGVTPRLSVEERWHGLTDRQWDFYYEMAESLLGVHRPSADIAGVEKLCDILSSRGIARPAPLAIESQAQRKGWRIWGPDQILASYGRSRTHGHIKLLAEHVAVRLIVHDSRVRFCRLRNLRTGRMISLGARAWVVAAGAVGSAQLLFASQFPSMATKHTPIGRWLTEHPLAHACVLLRSSLAVERNRIPLAIEIPPDCKKPFYRLVIRDVFDPRLRLTPGETPNLVHLFWYSRMRPNPKNRIAFQPTSDEYGLPEIMFEVQRDKSDVTEASALLSDLRQTVELLGTPVRLAPPQLLPPGSSQHIMGTTRMSTIPGHGVADTHGRVWDMKNVYLAGTSLIPTGTSTSPTLTAIALGMHTADQLIMWLEGNSPLS